MSIDGVDIRDMTLASLAATVGLVSQETYLFHASIRENLRFACPEATDEEIEDAARAAQIHGLISSLPEGYDTPVGERGYRFSGGEKQRMAIARTILRNPPVLILDEATSALDNGDRARRADRRSTSFHAGARRLRSRTASRRSATPIRFSCSTRGRSSSAERTRSWSSSAGAMRSCSGAAQPTPTPTRRVQRTIPRPLSLDAALRPSTPSRRCSAARSRRSPAPPARPGHRR